jgi:hypothetical protein
MQHVAGVVIRQSERAFGAGWLAISVGKGLKGGEEWLA